MNHLPGLLRAGYLSIGAVALFILVTLPAWAVDWDSIQGKQIILFYPGQASWEWALTPADHSGATKFREGKNCRECHGGEEKAMGELIVSGKKLEPDPIAGKRGWIPLTVKTAHDDERLYVRLEWPDDTQPIGRKLDPEVEARATVMLEDGHTVEALRAGCWGVCHDDMSDMASDPKGKKITKYLAASRTQVTRQGGGENYKSQAALDDLRKQGVFYEYWRADLNKGAEPKAMDGYILEQRHKNKAPAMAVEADHQDGQWVVVFSRKLRLADPHHKDIVPGKTYFIGFAVHDAYAEDRFHHVSLEHTLVLDQGKADFVAVRR